MRGLNKLALCVCLCMVFTTSISSQVPGRIQYIPMTTQEDVEELVIDTFIANDCFEVLNININGQFGNNPSIGYFREGMTALGMESGLVITNGPINEFNGGNSSTGAGSDLGLPGDSNLSAIEDAYGGTIGPIGQPGGDVATFDAGTVEFDFIPTSEEVSFKYIFASEEYCDYVGSRFNDKFGIFLSGPGINGPFTLFGQPAINIAEFTDLNGNIENVSINNINNSINPHLYVDNNTGGINGTATTTIGSCPGLTPNILANNPYRQLTQFDGWTVPLEATYDKLEICETYHVRIVVADGSDRIFGSAVFLQSSSFNAAQGAGVTDITFGDTGETYTYESCGDSVAIVDFTRQSIEGTNNFADIIIPIEITGSATYGLDYCTDLPIFGDITLGPFGAVREIVVKADSEIEGSEFINIAIQNPCFCDPEIYELEIINVPSMEVRPLVSDTACFNGMRDLRAIIEGGGFPSVDRADPPAEFEITWSDDTGVISNDAVHSVDISGAGSYTYYLEINDACGGLHRDTVNFVTSGIPDAELEGTFSICEENPDATLGLTLSGAPPWTLEYNLDGVPQTPIQIEDPNFEFIVSEPGEYEITRIDGPNCGQDVEGLAVVNTQSFLLDVMPTPTLCSDSEDGVLTAIVSGGSGTYTYLWSDDNAQDTEMATGLAPGMYTVTATDELGCEVEFDAEVVAAGEVSVTPSLVSGTTCADLASGEVSAEGLGGAGNYTYAWFDTAGTAVGTGAMLNGLTAGTYEVVVTDDNGCESMANVIIPSDENTPSAVAIPASIDCNNTEVTVNTSGTSLGAEFDYSWTVTSGGGSIMSGASSPNAVIGEPGSYILTVTNTTNGCTAIAPVVISDDRVDPTADAGTSFECIDDAVLLGGPNMEQGPNIEYEWTSPNGGAIQGAANVSNPMVSEAGIYEVLVTNTSTGCTAISQVEVSVTPEVNIETPAAIDCRGDGTVTLSGNGSETGTDIIYAWTAANGGVISAGANTINPSVSEEGTYILTVTNSATNCSNVMEIPVEDDRGDLVADPGQPAQIDCINPTLNLGGANTSAGPTITYEWQIVPTSGTPSTSTSANITATQGGTYTLLVTDSSNGCTAMENIVIPESTEDPIVNIADPALLTCEDPEQTLDSGGSSTAGNFTYTWTTDSGNIISSENDQNIDIDDPGMYTLTIINNDNGCQNSASIQVLEDAIFPFVSIATPMDIDCDNTQVLLDGSASDSGMGIEYTWTDGNNAIVGNAASITVDAAGEYTLSVNNTNTGCTETDPVTVMDIREDPVADLGLVQDLNCETMMITLGGDNISTGPEFSYAWSLVGGTFTSTLQNPEIMEGGEYVLIVTNMTNNCSAEESIMIPQDATPPVIDIEASGIITCQDPIQTLMSDGSSTGPDFEYSWTGPDGFTSNLENPEITLSGGYELTILNTANRCSVTETVEVDEDAEFPAIAIADPAVVNCRDMIIELSGDGSELGPDIEYIWVASNGGVIEDDEDSLNPEISAAGTYELTVSNVATGCSRTLEVEVTDDFEDPIAMVNSDLTFGCQDDFKDLSGEGSSIGNNISYEWIVATQGNFSGDANAIETQVDQPGEYTLIVTNTENGCTAEASLSITPDEDLPVVALEEPEVITCGRAMVMIDASGSDNAATLTYEWVKDGDIINPADNFLLEVEEPGTYTLTIEDTTNGCISTGSVIVEENKELPIAEAGDGIILNCRDMMLNLDADGSSSGPEFIYAWTAMNGGNVVSGEDSDEPLVDEPGMYLLTVTNTLTDCVSTDEVLVSRNDTAPVIEFVEASMLNCRDQMINIDASNSDEGGNFELEWTEMGTANIESGEETLTPLINAPGTYLLTIINTDNFCETTREIVIEQDIEEPTVAIAETEILTCATLEVELDGSASSQGDNFTYEWTSLSGGGSFVGATNEANAMANSPGMYQLLVINTDNFCENIFSIVVDENVEQPTVITGSPVEVTCDNPETTLSGAGSSVGPNFQYEWAPIGPGTIVSGGNTLTPTVSSAGNYVLTVLNTTNGCVDFSAQMVTSNDVFPQDDAPNPVVLNCAITEQVLAGSGNAGLTYEWTILSGGNIIGATDQSEITVDEPGIYVMTITSIDNGCETPYQIEVLQDTELPLANAGPGSNLDCTETVVALMGEGSEGPNFRYEWTTDDGTFMGATDELEAFATSVGTYTLNILNTENQCSSSSNVNVGVEGNVPTGIDAEALPPACFGDLGGIVFVGVNGGVGPFDYSIDNGQTFSDNTLFSELTPGATYDLLIQDMNGCTAVETILIPTVDSLSVNVAEPFIEIELGESFDVSAVTSLPTDEIASVTWTPSTGLSCDDCLTPTVTPGNSINYNVVVVSENGCVDEASIQFRVDRNIDIYIPNAFSPHNKDGVNDLFFPFGKTSLEATVKQFQIFDRWGEQVFIDADFELNDPKRGWKGEFRDDSAQPGVYVYYIVLEFVDGSTELYEGDVTLMQ